TWAPKGQTPVLRRVSRRRELSTIIGLTVSGHLVKRHSRRAFHGVDVVLFLKQLRRRFRSPLIIVWDRLSAHQSREVKDFLASERMISVEWLPPYAPDLNPEERCHGNAKQHLRNAAPEDEGDIRRQADREFARIGRDHELLMSFFRHAGISV